MKYNNIEYRVLVTLTLKLRNMDYFSAISTYEMV